MKTQTRDALKSALFEATFVLMGVLLALLANEWRQGMADRAEVDRALDAISEELRSNRDAVADSLSYHHERLGLLRGEETEGSLTIADFPRGFVLPARVTRIAWDSAAETGALAKMDLAMVMELSGAYAMQGTYEVQAQSIGEIIYGEIFRHGMESIIENPAHWASIVSTFVYREQEMVQHFDRTIAALEASRASDG